MLNNLWLDIIVRIPSVNQDGELLPLDGGAWWLRRVGKMFLVGDRSSGSLVLTGTGVDKGLLLGSFFVAYCLSSLNLASLMALAISVGFKILCSA
ncbi:unnamed protein product [Cuscuta campestris]|uniref:Uncharacterized protein n=1 Tax=Cuscuta campestris TaxID=132261 RepID=A0A484LIZ5_9ASTE|nr:unnamed protein product [Cuscuta campestris]